MKARNLREQSDEELQQFSRETAQRIAELRAKKGIGDASEQPLRVRTLRRDLARMKTVMRERRAGGNG